MNQVETCVRKKVLFLITKATWGGAQRYIFDLATHLPPDQFGVSVAYGQPGRLQKMLEEKQMEIHHLPALGRDIALFSDLMSFFQIIRLLWHVRPHVLHVNSSKAAALGVLAARFSGVPRIIFTAHGWPFKEDRHFFARSLIYFISWFTALLSHATIVVSMEDERIGKKMLRIRKKIHWIPLGIEEPVFLSREEASASLSLTTSASRIVSIGELTTNKGYQYAIDAMLELEKHKADVEYFIIGDGELRAQLEERAHRQGVAERVHFLGFVENASRYLKAFDVFLLPSTKEGMPYVLLEAVAADVPIVATNVVTSFASKFVSAADAQELAGAVETVLRHKDGLPKIPVPLHAMVGRTVQLY